MTEPTVMPAARPSLVATDCDGTLLRTDGSISEYTRGTLARVSAAGVTVVLVTARPPRWMHELGSLTGVDAVALCGNGAFVYDIQERVLLAHRLLELDVTAALIRDIRAELPGVSFAVETIAGCAREESFERASGRTDGEWYVGDLTALLSTGGPQDGPGKLLVRHRQLGTDELRDRVHAVVGGRAEVSHSGSPGMSEIAPPGVTKGRALARYCAEADIAADEVWAFGDMPNDLSMLAWAGRSFAVSNAHPDVQAMVDEICAPNDSDGVADTLERLLA